MLGAPTGIEGSQEEANTGADASQAECLPCADRKEARDHGCSGRMIETATEPRDDDGGQGQPVSRSQTQQYEERSASELANDLHEEDFPKPNVTRLDRDLRHTSDTIRGKRPGTFQIDVRHLSSLDQRYLPLLGTRQAKVTGKVLPPEMVSKTRAYLEQLVHQINGAYEYGFFDARAVMCRRLMESLIIEVYTMRSSRMGCSYRWRGWWHTSRETGPLP